MKDANIAKSKKAVVNAQKKSNDEQKRENEGVLCYDVDYARGRGPAAKGQGAKCKKELLPSGLAGALKTGRGGRAIVGLTFRFKER